MQWADLRALSSSTRRVARMNTIAVRRQLPPLLLRAPPTRTPLASLSPCSRDGKTGARRFSAGAGPRTEKGRRHKSRKKDSSPSIFEEIFPEMDFSPKRQVMERQRGSKKTAENPEEDNKVRFVTSINVDKSEYAIYKAAGQAVKPEIQSPLKARRTAAKKPEKADDWKASQGANAMIPPLQTKAQKHAAYWKAKQEATSQIPDLLSQANAGKTRPKPEPSLFDELFESKDTPATTAKKQLIENRSVDHNDLQAWIDSLSKDDGTEDADKNRPAMLILSNASPNLLEAEFYRIGPQGQHLDGWSASIRKVIQAHDYNNLDQMGRYFIIFDSRTAAANYQKEAQRRHALARRALRSSSSPTLPEANETFTLAPPSDAPLSLHLYKLNKATESRIETFSVQGLLSMTPDPPPRAGSHVILGLEGGTLDQRTLSQWIRRDARDRNLGWPVQHMRPYFGLKLGRHPAKPEEEPEEEPERDDFGPVPVGLGREKSPSEMSRSARFVLSFPDVHEARRFIRAWHGKSFAQSRGDAVTVNAHLVW